MILNKAETPISFLGKVADIFQTKNKHLFPDRDSNKLFDDLTHEIIVTEYSLLH